MTAVLNNKTVAAKHLLDHKDIKINISRAKDGTTPGHVAAAEGKVEMLRLLLKHPDFDINMQAPMGITPLMYGIAFGRPEVVEFLLAQPGVDVNAQSKAFTVTSNTDEVKTNMLASALATAAYYGNVVAVRLLLAHPDIRINDGGVPPLSVAAEKGHLAIVKLILTHPDIDPNAIVEPYSQTALILASAEGHHEVVRELLRHKKTDVNARASCGGVKRLRDDYYVMETGWAHSALTMACLSGHLKVVEALLDDPDIRVAEGNRSEGEVALHFALENDHHDIVKYLLKKLDIKVGGVL